MRKVILYIILSIILSCAEANPNPVFDFTKFKGKNINEINAIIGKPNSNVGNYQNEIMGYHYNSYRKNNILLMIKFNPTTLKIISYDLISSKTYTKVGILKLANLDESTMDGFSLDESDQITFLSNGYRGITIIPNN